jgi:hypothetical protein
LLPAVGTGLPGWLGTLVVALGAGSALAIVVSLTPVGALRAPAVFGAALVLAAAAALVTPVVASASMVGNDLGPFNSPFEPPASTAFLRAFLGSGQLSQSLSQLSRIEQVRNGAPYLFAAQTSVLASPYVYATGDEVLPIGGFTGTIPEPSVGRVRSMVAAGDFHLVLTGPHPVGGAVGWIAEHCQHVAAAPNGGRLLVSNIKVFYCLRPDAAPRGTA